MMFLNEIRKRVGTKSLDAALKDYYQAEAYKVTNQDAFFDALARHTSEDISDLVKGYFAGVVDLPCGISDNEAG